MGYTTDFTGQFDLDKTLLPRHAAYLKRFAGSRRMERNESVAVTLPDPLREAVLLPVGENGCYYVGTDELDKERGECAGQGKDASVVEYNRPPHSQPGLWCQWVPTDDGKGVEWNGAEKFYYYTEWLQYLIDNFLSPWGYTLNGRVEWSGEEPGDLGAIFVRNNKVRAVAGRVEIAEPKWD